MYKEKLRKFAKDHNIMENSELNLGLWTQISLDITYLMMHTTNRVQTRDDEFIRNVNPNEYILAAFNYLIAVTAKELGSPKLPIEFFRKFFKIWAENILTAKPRTDISLNDTFNSQRRIDAIDLRSDRIDPLLRDINDKKNLAENVTKLYAEYQALVRRQANHGFFWRLFHSAENDARTALINELRETLHPYVPDIDLTSKTPTSPYLVAMAADEEATVRGINAGVSLDERDMPTVFGYDKERANNPLNNAQPQIDLNNIIEQNSIISQADSNEFELVMEEHNGAIANEEENKEEIKEEIEEANNEPVEIVKENPQPKILSATEQFNKINNYNLRAWIEDQMWSQIQPIVNYSVSKYTALMGAATPIIGLSETLNKTYDQVKAVDNDPKVLKTLIHDTIHDIFYAVYKGFESCRLRPKDQLVAAQKMTDIVLNELTVVGFYGAEYSEFAKNYTISNDVGLYDFLATNYPGIFAVDIKDIVDKARKELGVDLSAISDLDIINDLPLDVVIEDLEGEEQSVEQPIIEEPTVDNIFNKLTGENGMLAFYDKSGALSVRKDKQEVYFNDMMKNIILRSAIFLCDATKEIYSNREVETAVHQKILDVFLKNYSPVPFSKGNVGLFADGFLLAQGDVFAQYYLKNINRIAKPEEVNDFLNKVRVVSAELDKKASANEPAIKDDKNSAPEKEQISVDLSKADAPKVDAPKVDEPKVEAAKVEANEPAREKIAVNEAFDNVGSAKVSNKVEEIKAPVSSKSKE